MSGSVTTDASQHTNNNDRVLEIPNRCDNATLIEQWCSALPEPTKRVIHTELNTPALAIERTRTDGKLFEREPSSRKRIVKDEETPRNIATTTSWKT